jgi:hypothetical protein
LAILFLFCCSKSNVFKHAFASGGASIACNRNQGSLCSPYGQTMEHKGAMLIATSPQAFDARSHGAMGSFSAVAQPKGNTLWSYVQVHDSCS